jgi:hypothetical protein
MFSRIGNVTGKIFGRRNWVIKTMDNNAYLMSWGYANRNNQLTNTLDFFYEHNIHWLSFTYKKDAFNALEEIKKLGYKTEIRA